MFSYFLCWSSGKFCETLTNLTFFVLVSYEVRNLFVLCFYVFVIGTQAGVEAGKKRRADGKSKDKDSERDSQ
jgi:hypothetical protein